MNALWRRWEHFWFARFDPFALGLFRISLGLLMLGVFLFLLPSWERYFAVDGVASLVDPEFRSRQDPWSVFYWTEGLVPVRAYWWLGIVACLAFSAGWLTRVWTVVLYVLQTSMIHRNLMIVNGEDLVFRMLLFYGCFAPLGSELSIDSRLRKRRDGPRTATDDAEGWPRFWAVRLMQINTLLIYVFSLPLKLVSDGSWLSGDAMYFVMINSSWSRWPWPEVFYGGLLSMVLTYSTVLVEASFPILVWFRRTRLWAIAAMTAFHLGIAFFLQNVTMFSLSMVCAFWVFIPGDDARRWVSGLAKVAARVTSARTRPLSPERLPSSLR